MSVQTASADGDAMVTLPETRSIPAGWRVIGVREFTEHLLSIRFIALLLVLGLAGLLAIYAVGGSIRDVASQIPTTVTGQKLPVFPVLFTTSPAIPGITGQSFPSFAGLVALLGPVLGIAFGFDAISSERSEGTLPRLVSQPIHRDDVINGKFVAGLAVITMILGAVILMLCGVGIVRLGIVPDGDVAVRLVAWFLAAALYVAFWLALATLGSVVFRRAATAALVVIAIWLVLTFFGDQIVSVVGNTLRPLPANPTADQQLANAQMVADLGRLNPITLFTEMTQALLNPLVQSLDPYFQDPTGRALPTILPFGQSLLLIWPHVVLLLAGTVICFAAAYVSFMRQEIRA
jgi:ABC-2 type transport system permease protein